ncbi:kinase-like domain-containing protein [Rhizophagus clarus]|uniref:Kinase-like domain-containing protein n=1 Tax=Rhizophagus clarus TaxID=94130 RepID=A0A8H3MIY6_9GLOM|nr:kinase-like domain-containing protein [Rhizophagus clarus]
MSDNIKMHDTENKTEWINWIEEAIDKEHIKYFEYNEFNNFQEIGTGGFGKVLDNVTVKEIVRELKIQRKVDYHDNIIRCHGITKFVPTESQNSHLQNYWLVMEYANSGSLRSYLEENFDKLTWDDKYNMAYQLACAVSCLHNEEIIHRDLHSCNILVHQNTIKLADFGLSKRIGAGHPPFYIEGEEYDAGLAVEVLQGLRETVVSDTPENYVTIYTKCWDGEPDNRPTIHQVVDWLEMMITKADVMTENFQSSDKQEFDEASLSTSYSELRGELSQLIQNFDRMDTKEIESIAILNKQENLSTEKDFNMKVDQINDFIFKLLNKGFEVHLSKQKVIDVDYKEAFNLFINASEQDHVLAQFFVSDCYQNGYGIIKNERLAFKYYEKVANENLSSVQLNIGYCYNNGLGIQKDLQKAFYWMLL